MAKMGRPRTAMYVPWVATFRVQHSSILCGGDSRLKPGSLGRADGSLHGSCPACGRLMHPKGAKFGVYTWHCGLCGTRVCVSVSGYNAAMEGVITPLDLIRRIEQEQKHLLDLNQTRDDLNAEIQKKIDEITRLWSTLSDLVAIGSSNPTAKAKAVLQQENGLARLASIIQASLQGVPPELMEDVRQEMMALLLDSTVSLGQIPQRIHEILRRLRGEQGFHWGPVSLDESKPSLSGDLPPLIERIAGPPEDDPQVQYN